MIRLISLKIYLDSSIEDWVKFAEEYLEN